MRGVLPETQGHEVQERLNAARKHLFEKAQKSSHCSFEVECSSCKHDVNGVSEETLVEVSA